MANTITAGNGTNNGLAVTSDNTGALNILTGSGGGTAAISIDSSQNVTMAANLSVTGNTTITGTISATGGVTGSLTRATAQASTSGTSIDFTGIPSGVKRITVMFNGVSTSGASVYLIQLGTSSGFVTTGYTGSTGVMNNAAASAVVQPTTGIGIYNDNAGRIIYGSVIITNVSSNIWVASGSIGTNTTFYGGTGAVVTLSAILDRVRITTTNGTDTFDAGSINIIYE